MQAMKMLLFVLAVVVLVGVFVVGSSLLSGHQEYRANPERFHGTVVQKFSEVTPSGWGSETIYFVEVDRTPGSPREIFRVSREYYLYFQESVKYNLSVGGNRRYRWVVAATLGE